MQFFLTLRQEGIKAYSHKTRYSLTLYSLEILTNYSSLSDFYVVKYMYRFYNLPNTRINLAVVKMRAHPVLLLTCVRQFVTNQLDELGLTYNDKKRNPLQSAILTKTSIS